LEKSTILLSSLSGDKQLFIFFTKSIHYTYFRILVLKIQVSFQDNIKNPFNASLQKRKSGTGDWSGDAMQSTHNSLYVETVHDVTSAPTTSRGDLILEDEEPGPNIAIEKARIDANR
jgi:hypothetical protein